MSDLKLEQALWKLHNGAELHWFPVGGYYMRANGCWAKLSNDLGHRLVSQLEKKSAR